MGKLKHENKKRKTILIFCNILVYIFCFIIEDIRKVRVNEMD